MVIQLTLLYLLLACPKLSLREFNTVVTSMGWVHNTSLSLRTCVTLDMLLNLFSSCVSSVKSARKYYLLHWFIVRTKWIHGKHSILAEIIIVCCSNNEWHVLLPKCDLTTAYITRSDFSQTLDLWPSWQSLPFTSRTWWKSCWQSSDVLLPKKEPYLWLLKHRTCCLGVFLKSQNKTDHQSSYQLTVWTGR